MLNFSVWIQLQMSESKFHSHSYHNIQPIWNMWFLIVFKRMHSHWRLWYWLLKMATEPAGGWTTNWFVFAYQRALCHLELELELELMFKVASSQCQWSKTVQNFAICSRSNLHINQADALTWKENIICPVTMMRLLVCSAMQLTYVTANYSIHLSKQNQTVSNKQDWHEHILRKAQPVAWRRVIFQNVNEFYA